MKCGHAQKEAYWVKGVKYCHACMRKLKATMRKLEKLEVKK